MAGISNELGVNELMAGQSVLSRPAEEFENDATVEAMWAMKAFEHAEIYFNILCSVDPKILKLTPHDDVLYKTFREMFPDMKLDVLVEDEIKSPEGKEKWRGFCEKFKEMVEDYSFGTLIRTKVDEEYSENNSFLVPRVQFFAIEIARNREGFNDVIKTKFKPKKLQK